jgi:hypothetical protein
MTNRPNLTEEEKEHYNKVAMDMIYREKLDKISCYIQDNLDEAYELFAEEAISREDYINFLNLQTKMLTEEAEKHQAVLDSEIKKVLDTSS